jgi:arabinofuranosyltransferase
VFDCAPDGMLRPCPMHRGRHGSNRQTILSPEVLLLVGGCALVLAAITAAFPHLWPERWVQDDAYVSFRYARNLVRGAGLVYNPGERVEGYTNFLWTLLAAAPLAAGADDPLTFMHAVSAALWFAAYALLLALGIALWADGVWAAPLIALPLALHWSFNLWFVSGMETPLVTALTIAAVAAATLDPRRHWWAPAAVSTCGVALMLTRPDGAIEFAALVAVIAMLDGGWIIGARRWRTAVLLPAIPVIAIWVPYQIWRVAYYGAWLPNTYYAKVAYLTFYARGWAYLRTYVDIYRLRWFAALAVCGAAAAPPRTMAQRYLFASLAVTAAVAFYVVRLGGDFMEWRFLTPVSGVFYPAAVLGAAVLGERLAASRTRAADRRGLAGFLAGAVTAAALAAMTRAAMPLAQTVGMPDQETIALLRRYTDPGRYDWRSAGRLCAAAVPAGARIATTSAGIIPYLCDRACLDLHGLTDPEIAHSPVDPRRGGRIGHEHWLKSYETMRRRGVDVVVEWVEPDVYPHAAARGPRDGRELVSARLPDGRFIDFTVLNPAVAAAMRDNPHLVFFDPATIADRTRFHALADAFAAEQVIDALDWGNAKSERTHALRIHQPDDGPYDRSWHTKFLAYLPPHEQLRLEDDGSRVYGWAEWRVDHVSSARDLVLIARHDHTGAAAFDVAVNGVTAPDPLVAAGRPDEWWGESWVRIPKALLRDGVNAIRITRRTESERDAEWYYMWFLQ